MPATFPFRAVTYNTPNGDVRGLIAPPYDVLDTKAKAGLIGANAHNIVSIDLPHTPAKELGPPEAYATAAKHYADWMRSGVLRRADKPAIFAYRQVFEFLGKRFERCGMACTIDTVPFGPRKGGGVLPHEQTFSGPKEDRFALMKATSCQLSPIFGLYADDLGRGTKITRSEMASREPDMTGDIGDGVQHEVWTVTDPSVISAFSDALIGEDIFVADGHHRYNTALNYLSHLESSGGLASDHPARRTMFVLVGMSDPGLAIGPTHRVLGGMQGYSWEAFNHATKEHLEIEVIGKDPASIERTLAKAQVGTCVLGLLDFKTGTCAIARPRSSDPLATMFPSKSAAWRGLDVAIIQHLLVEKICVPSLNSGKDIKWAFPHSMPEVLEIGSGRETGAGGGAGFAQVAVIVRPTPLAAVRDVSKANELMPQKSTFFYPKLATGLFLNPLA